MTQKLAAIHTLDELARMTDAQAAELRASMLRTGQFPPPASLPALPTEQLRVSLGDLTAALTGQALVWEQVGGDVPRLSHFANGLIYAGSMLRSFRELDASPLNVFTMFTTWALSFTRNVLEESGHRSAQSDALLEELGVNAPQLPQVLNTLPHDLARGSFMAALSVFHAAAHAMSCVDAEALHDYFISAGRDLAGPDWRPPFGPGGMNA